MRKNLLLVLFIFSSCFFYSQERNPKIGLSLSGGGAKGFAHIGVLKVIDSLGIKIDYISGTSMGAIVGSLYASGYSGKDIEKIMKETDFYSIIANEKNRQEASFFTKDNDKYLLSIPVINGKFNVLPKAISTGQKNIYLLKELLNNVVNTQDFSELPIPFMCIGTNLENGKTKIFEKGNLINSIMASSAYPGLVDPVKIEDSLYIDGAITINYPSKPLKDKGMDIVIGVDLSQPLSKKEELNSAVSILNQIIDYSIKKETKNQYLYTDINIHPKLDGLSSTSYGNKEKILQIGYQEALKYVPTLSLLPKKNTTHTKPILYNTYKIDHFSIDNSKIFNKSYVQGKMGLKIPSIQTFKNINTMIDKLYATNNYTLINYDLIQQETGNTLKLIVSEDDTRFFLKFGLHYNDIFKTGLLVNSTIKRFLFHNSTLSLDLVMGDTPRYYFNYFVDNGYIPGFGIYSSGMTIPLKDNNGNNVEKHRWIHNNIFIQSILKDKFAIGGGISHDYFESKIGSSDYNHEINYINPYAFIKSDTRDSKDFPTRGFYLDANAKFLDFFDNEKESKNVQLKGNMQFNFPISNLFTYRLNLFGGFSLKEHLSKYYQFYPGGILEQNLGNFITFYGYQFGNIGVNNILTAGNDFQFRFKKNYFIVGHLNLLNTFEEHQAKSVFKIQDISAGITLGYKSPFGQIKLNLSRAIDKRKAIASVILGHWF